MTENERKYEINLPEDASDAEEEAAIDKALEPDIEDDIDDVLKGLPGF